MLSALRYRAGQVVVIALLAALVTTCAAFAPLYDRAMQQAAVAVALEDAPSALRDLQIYGPDAEWSLRRTAPDDLVGLLPSTEHLFQKPVLGSTATTRLDLDRLAPVEGELWWRAGQCDHVDIAVGSCPAASRQIMVTEAEAEEYGFTVGTVVKAKAASLLATVDNADPEIVHYEIVGIYRAADPDWWQGLQLDGRAGVAASDLPRHDAWLTDQSTFSTPTPVLPREHAWVGYRLRTDEVGVDELAALKTDLVQLSAMLAEDSAGTVGGSPDAGDPSSGIVSSLPALADRVDAQIQQSRTTVPLLLCQLGLLGVIVLWLMLLAATDQRRSEVVVARLRGRGTAGARTLLMRELLPAVLLGVVPGVGIALLGAWPARALVLPGDPPFELPRGLVAAVLIAVAMLVLVTYVAVVRVAREPLGTLLHRAGGRRPGWRLGVGDAIAIAVSGAGVVAFATGSLTGALALAAPALLSVFVGLVLAHLLPPVAARLGGTLLYQGRLRAGVSLLDASRSIMTRRTVALATVAGSLAVFSVCGLVVGDRNRELAAEQAIGAPVVVQVQSASLTDSRLKVVETVLADLDPDGKRVTPVVRTASPSGQISTLAVDPEAFSRIALFADGAPSQKAWSALSGSSREPVPTITAGSPAEEEAGEVTVLGVDGVHQKATRVAVADRIPGDGPNVTVVDLSTATALATPDYESSIALWFAAEDPAFVDTVVDTLASEGVFAADTRTLAGVRHSLDASIPSWSLWLGVVVGFAAVLLAVVALTVLTVTGWRVLALDLTALRLAGVDQRTVAGIPTYARLLPVLVGVIAGAGCGAICAALTLPDIPLLAVPPDVDVTDLSIPWAAVAMTTAGCLIVLGAAAALLGHAVAAMVRFDRLREAA
ncbi:FtsX-like permease family protein [Nocardioides sp. NPDC101246]|uniref:FtsX-like permease family protein n=1 Tax=Nocardioides sp. NPDC101246 TaxID=3364336 RepID=UPI0037F10EBF